MVVNEFLERNDVDEEDDETIYKKKMLNEFVVRNNLREEDVKAVHEVISATKITSPYPLFAFDAFWLSPPWFFIPHVHRAFELMDKLDKLESLKMISRHSFQLTKMISRFPNLRYLQIKIPKRERIRRDNVVVDIGPISILEGKRTSNLEAIVLVGHCIVSETF